MPFHQHYSILCSNPFRLSIMLSAFWPSIQTGISISSIHQNICCMYLRSTRTNMPLIWNRYIGDTWTNLPLIYLDFVGEEWGNNGSARTENESSDNKELKNAQQSVARQWRMNGWIYTGVVGGGLAKVNGGRVGEHRDIDGSHQLTIEKLFPEKTETFLCVLDSISTIVSLTW